jgi:hypothetical protein
VPSFPGVIAPLEELWISWLMKEVPARRPTMQCCAARPEEDAMKELTFETVIAVLEEIFIPGLFWEPPERPYWFTLPSRCSSRRRAFNLFAPLE